MGFFASIVVGVIAGWIAGKIMRGSGYGFWMNLLLGMLGSSLGGWLGGLIFKVDLTTGINFTTIATSVVGAIIAISIYRATTGDRTA